MLWIYLFANFYAQLNHFANTKQHVISLIILTVLGMSLVIFILWLHRATILRNIEKNNPNSIRIMRMIESVKSKLDEKVDERTRELVAINSQLNHEIIERKSVEHQLNVSKEYLVRLAHYDMLTSLPNRVFFNEILNKAIQYSKKRDKSFALLFIDLDSFKIINDTYGHSSGDEALKEIGYRFTKSLRAGDIVARLGGDEYIVLLNDIDDTTSAGTVAEKLLNECMRPMLINSHEFTLNASIGISLYPRDGLSLEDLQHHADMAMYKAKHTDHRYAFYDNEMNIAELEHIRLEAALRDAIKNKEFVLHFQPLLTLKTHTIQSVEALIRWEHPELGLVSPAKFIPLAEESGLIISIGEWVVNEACRINKSWQDAGYDPITVAVNISPKQFHHQDVAKMVTEALESNKLEPKYLKIEITETAVMDNVENAIKKLNTIHDMGVQISIDDFGTGYTSISYLRQYPVSVLKIDQTFIKGIPSNPNDVAITSAVIGLGHNLGLEVIAEGVETVEQIEFLSAHDCDTIQGYFFSRPVPASKLVQQLTKKGVVTDSVIQSDN